jgi:hypothetical protein
MADRLKRRSAHAGPGPCHRPERVAEKVELLMGIRLAPVIILEGTSDPRWRFDRVPAPRSASLPPIGIVDTLRTFYGLSSTHFGGDYINL